MSIISRPGVDPGYVARVDEASDLAVDCARIAIDDKDGLVGRTDEKSAKEACTGDRTIGGSPLGQMSVHRFANSRDNVNFA